MLNYLLPLTHTHPILNELAFFCFFFFVFFCLFVCLFVLLFRAALVTYGSCQARGGIGAKVARRGVELELKLSTTDLHHSHSNARSKPILQPTPQLTTTLDP